MSGVWHRKRGMKSPVFHQFTIPNISPSQADRTHLPKKTYGIQLKGSSFSKTVSFSLNFLRRSVWTCFRKKKKVEVLQRWKRSEFSQDTATFHPRCCSKVCLLSKMWANLRHHYLPFSSRPFKETLRGKAQVLMGGGLSPSDDVKTIFKDPLQ